MQNINCSERKLRINDSKTNLADNGLHSLNMGEVRHVCRLKTEENKKQIKENIMCRLKMNMPSPCGFNGFEFILYQIIEKTYIEKLLLQIIQISPQVQCNKHACRHRDIYIHKVIESAKTI